MKTNLKPLKTPAGIIDTILSSAFIYGVLILVFSFVFKVDIETLNFANLSKALVLPLLLGVVLRYGYTQVKKYKFNTDFWLGLPLELVLSSLVLVITYLSGDALA